MVIVSQRKGRSNEEKQSDLAVPRLSASVHLPPPYPLDQLQLFS